jgi:amidase
VLAEQALADADAADQRRGDGAPALNGVPVAVKDDTDVAGQLTARGSLAHDGVPAAADSEVVRRLRAAGAIVVGKTNVPELEALCVTESFAYGATHNPWDPTRTPGGSSGGSAAAVSAGLVAAALGSDGAGSIRIPAACCGIFGLKPQRDRLPAANGWSGLSCNGALTRSVLDTALLLDELKQSGPPYAAAAARPPGALRIAYSFALPRGATTRPDDEQRGAVERTAERLRALGHRVEQHDPNYGNSGIDTLARYLDGIATDAAGMARPELLARHTRGLAALGTKLPAFATRRAREQEAADRERIAASLAGFDVLMTPVFTRRPPKIGEWMGLPAPLMLNGMMNFVPHLGLYNHTGQPAAAVPVEAAPDGFPIAVQLVGRPDDEPTLLALAAQLETDTGWLERRPAIAL